MSTLGSCSLIGVQPRRERTTFWASCCGRWGHPGLFSSAARRKSKNLLLGPVRRTILHPSPHLERTAVQGSLPSIFLLPASRPFGSPPRLPPRASALCPRRTARDVADGNSPLATRCSASPSLRSFLLLTPSVAHSSRLPSLSLNVGSIIRSYSQYGLIHRRNVDRVGHHFQRGPHQALRPHRGVGCGLLWSRVQGNVAERQVAAR